MLLDQNLVAVLHTLIDRLGSTAGAPGLGQGPGQGPGLAPGLQAGLLDTDNNTPTIATDSTSSFSSSTSFSLLVEAKALLELLN